jgi:UDP-4-amino-4-deoxy-L-arabinose formyltransferase/UDP-glucuronic acid dehydrogenase (UDP-4-keto-hexauronic acid decarboxylating)
MNPSEPRANTMSVPKKKVLLLGAGGFIGCHMVKYMSSDEHRDKYDVTCVDLYDDKIKDQLDRPNVTFIQLDIRTEPAEVERLCAETDLVVDLVAIANPSLYVTNPLDVYHLDFTENLKIVEYCHKHKKRILQFSTCEVYGISAATVIGKDPKDMPIPFSEDSTPLIMGPIKNQRWIYACSKQLLERVLHAYGLEKGLNYSIIRPFNFVGPQIDYLPSEEEGCPRIFSHFINGLLYGTDIKLVDGGKVWRGYTYIDDAVDCIMRIVDNPGGVCDRQIFNIGAPENEMQIKDLAQKVVDIFNKNFKQEGDPTPRIVSVSGEEFYGKGYEDCDRRIADITKAKTLLGWEPKDDMDTLIYKTLESFVNEFRAKQAAGKIPAAPAPSHVNVPPKKMRMDPEMANGNGVHA